ncbi:CocE/NonD family hydrolase [Roseovarius sp. SCSIO 43702]|uniref:CocE/NonD family hydrolase n=1 Tax=Roseovarius sp. SCSIO 43702 TaxID=2823043 RepID=UPI002176187A|nr:CocE/NonD family hydrolase [Roseovarius sp. SCSIO 43702]
MTEVDRFQNTVKEIHHTEIEMPDGCKLAARIWMPADAEEAPVPAILEYLPYRKNDFTTGRDAPMQPYLAGHGYAVIRLDLRGAGDSEGLMEDEYTAQELQDGYDAIAWIADQPWCDGNVGMIGISWGGFNGLQIAAMQPPALRTIITLCSTDDRYADDIHYMGGCVLGEHPSWASIMFARNSLAPDPANVGDKWREMWMERLEGSGLWLKTWLEHQTRDEFWKHGSICEDWSKIQIPVYAVSGWADGYCRAVFRLMENLQGPKKGLVGPWAHRYPHIGEPGPAIGFLQEEVRWFDQWMKGRDTGIMEEPQLRLYMQDSVPPRGWYGHRPGRWIAEPSWPSPNIRRTAFHLGSDGSLDRAEPRKRGSVAITSPATVGMASGRWCAYSAPGDAPVDQRAEDAGSLCFDTVPLEEALEFAGDAQVRLRVSVDKPVAQLAARLCDVDPDGRSTRVSFGVLNLTHRDGHEAPEPLEPGEIYEITIPMKHVAQRISEGHRLRLAISTSYFPMIWPAPEPVRLILHAEGSSLDLPLRPRREIDAALPPFEEVETAPQRGIEQLEEPDLRYLIVEDAAANETRLQIGDGDGRYRLEDNGLTVHEQGYETFTVPHDDVTRARAHFRWSIGLERDDWSARSETETTMTSDVENFYIVAKLRAWEGDSLVKEIEWDEAIPRNMV